MGEKRLKLRYFIFGIIIVLILNILWRGIYNDRPFIFESYKDSEKLLQGLEFKFPVGVDVSVVLNVLESSGADCYIRANNKFDDGAKIVFCNYVTSLFSLHPLESYSVWMKIDMNDRIISHNAVRVSGMMLITPP